MVVSERELKRCGKCGRPMVLERVVPKFGPLPEVQTYKCLWCGNIVAVEDENSVPDRRPIPRDYL